MPRGRAARARSFPQESGPLVRHIPILFYFFRAAS